MFVNKDLSVSPKQITLGDVYGLAKDFTFRSKQFNLLVVYRTYDSNIDAFLTELENYYDSINLNKSCIFLGDINLYILKNDIITNRYFNCLKGNGLLQVIDKPTRVTGTNKSCLDHIFVRYKDGYKVRGCVAKTSTTDTTIRV